MDVDPFTASPSCDFAGRDVLGLHAGRFSLLGLSILNLAAGLAAKVLYVLLHAAQFLPLARGDGVEDRRGAAANGDGACAGGTGSTPVSTSSLVKKTRTASARDPKRRSHPRTVAAGRPDSAAIGRAPFPDALAASAAPITSARSARLSSANTGSST